MAVASITIVKNGMPYIGKVLRQVAPFMQKMFVTISEKSDDGTIAEVNKVWQDWKEKMEVDFENVKFHELTEIRNKQVDKCDTEWILHLDDDDYWPEDQLRLCIQQLDKEPEILAYDVNPYQLINKETHDASWQGKKWFSKFLRKGARYRYPFPKDLPCDTEGKPLYWKTHDKVKHLPHYFYHLALMKGYSFRNNPEQTAYAFSVKNPQKLPQTTDI